MAGAAFVLPQPTAVDTVASRTARTSRDTAVQLRPGMAAGSRCRGMSRSERRRLCNATSSAMLFFVMSVRPKAGIHTDSSIPASNSPRQIHGGFTPALEAERSHASSSARSASCGSTPILRRPRPIRRPAIPCSPMLLKSECGPTL